MKKMIIGFFAVLLAAATAWGNYQPATATTDDELHWFEGTVYKGTGTIEEKEQICNGETEDICLEGFMSAPGQQRPNVPPSYTLYREE